MTAYFLDTSAVAKRYLEETGAGWIHTIANPLAGNIITVCDLTPIEFFSLLARRQREKTLTEDEATRLKADFLLHLMNEYLSIQFEKTVLAQARDFVGKYPLRPPDALQLASAIHAKRVLKESVTFVCADHQLLTAAEAEGLLVDNPNLL